MQEPTSSGPVSLRLSAQAIGAGNEWFAHIQDGSRDFATLGGFPERIPIFPFQHDGVGFGGGLDTFQLIGANDRQRPARVSQNPGIGELFQRRAVVA